MLWPSDENRPYRITQAGMMSKFRKWHLREPKFAKFPRGACPRTPLDACAFGTNNYSLFSITWGWNLCTIWVPNHRIFHIISWETIIVSRRKSTILTKNPWNTYLCTSLSLCNDEMWLQSYVATTTLQKGGGNKKDQNCLKVFVRDCRIKNLVLVLLKGTHP